MRDRKMPLVGGFICWKVARTREGDKVLVRLRVAPNALRYQHAACSPTATRMIHVKVRVSSARVLDIWRTLPALNQHQRDYCRLVPTRIQGVYTSCYHKVNGRGDRARFWYRVGKSVRTEREFFRGDRPCASGIHAFMDFEDAYNHLIGRLY